MNKNKHLYYVKLDSDFVNSKGDCSDTIIVTSEKKDMVLVLAQVRDYLKYTIKSNLTTSNIINIDYQGYIDIDIY